MSTPQTASPRFFLLDAVLLVLALVLAFFLGSFASNNADVFLHLSLSNPFSNNPNQSGWVHHAWLTSSLLRLIYEPLSPTAETGARLAVVAKALVVAAMAFVMSFIRRRDQGWLAPILCTALTVIVMSPRLILQPQIVSLLFLGITLLVLTLPRPQYPRAIWLLPFLFALWVNMDSWFLLGPITLLLWLAGEAVQLRFGGKSQAGANRLNSLGLVFCVGLASCLLNPWHIRAFTLPMDMAVILQNVLPSGTAGAGRVVGKIHENSPRFVELFSPWSADYWSRTGPGRNLAGLAYFALLGLDVASFVLVFLRRAEKSPIEKINFPLLFVFVFFALLSALNWRIIVVYAVVGGPIAALNIQDFLGARRANDSAAKSATNLGIGVRVLAVFGCLLLLACAWPGWLHGNAESWRYSHHVAWKIAEDPGVIEAGKVIQEVQKQTGLCKLGFNYSLEGGNQFALCRLQGQSTVQLMCNARFALTAEQALAYGKIRNAIREEAELGFSAQEPQALGKMRQLRESYQGLMRSLGVDYVVFSGLHYDIKAQKIVESMLVDLHRQWVPLYLDGRTAVFGWIDLKAASEGYRKFRFDYYRLATSATLPPNVPQVVLEPGQAAPPPADTSGDLHHYLYGPTRPAFSTYQSECFQSLCKLAARDWQRHNIDLLIASCGGAVTLASNIVIPEKGPKIERKDLQGNLFTDPLFKAKDRMPPGAVFLAIRSARKATFESPNDRFAYFALGHAYELCWPQEDYWAGRPAALKELYKPELRVQLRLIQIVNAFHNTLAIDPENGEAHHVLHELYFKMGYFDLSLDHLVMMRKGLDSVRTASADDATKLEKLKKDYDEKIKAFGEEITRRQEAFRLATTGQQDAVDKFERALFESSQGDVPGKDPRRGLVKLGLQILLDANVEGLLNNPTKLNYFVNWQLYLLLTTGKAREAAERLEDANLRNVLPAGEYEQFRALAAAALGDYAGADKFLQQAEGAKGLPSDQQLLAQQQNATQDLARQFTAAAAWTPASAEQAGQVARLGIFSFGLMDRIGTLMLGAKERREVAELRLMRGLLALESGDTSSAIKHFRGSLDILPLLLPITLDFTDRPIALRCLELLEAK